MSCRDCEYSFGDSEHLSKKRYLKDDSQKSRKCHRRMHSDGSARLTPVLFDSFNGNLNNENISGGTGYLRRRKFPEFCLFGDSNESPVHSQKSSSEETEELIEMSIKSKSSLNTHRRSASHSGNYFTFAAHEFGEVATRTEELVIHLWKKGWSVVNHHSLPHWLRDNDFLLFGHRPELSSFRECFRSIFRLHTETGNIWTHLIGFICFLILSISFIVRPGLDIHWQEQMILQVFFISAILALGFSWLFHTVHCHSERVGKFFNKLDYIGIALLVIGSFVPWLHYSFYCHKPFKFVYIVGVSILGSICVFVCTQDYFLTPKYRAARAVLFIALGLFGVIPCTHYILMEGFWDGVSYSALGWLFLMAALYITGATVYALRIPERLYPGKFDIWFQSHQIFHVFVVLAALVHLNSIMEMAQYRLTKNSCG